MLLKYLKSFFFKIVFILTSYLSSGIINQTKSVQIMKISTRSRYGIKAMAYLALKNKYCCVKEVSETEKIPFEYLEKIFSQLKKNNLVTVKRGSQGGYILSRQPKDITIAEIMQSLEGRFTPVKCVDINFKCPDGQNCLTQRMWKKIQDGFISTLSSINLASLIEKDD